MKIASVDPGIISGIVLYDVDTLVPTETYSPAQLYSTLTVFEPELIICERFKPRRGAFDPAPLKAIGVVELYAEQHGTEERPQDPSQAKFFWMDQRIKYFGLWRPGMPHAMDALRHLLYYLCEKNGYEWVAAKFSY